MQRQMRALRANLWRAIEWATVMATLAWLLAHARRASASTARRGRRWARRGRK